MSSFHKTKTSSVAKIYSYIPVKKMPAWSVYLLIVAPFVSLAVMLPVSAAPSAPSNLTISGSTNQPTLSWDEVEAEPNAAEWSEVTAVAEWSKRRLHTSAVFDNKLWIMGGFDGSVNCNGSGSGRCNDVWYSEDGVNWVEATAGAAWSPRNGHTSAVFDSKLWVMGGFDGSGNCNGSGSSRCNDVWYSEDGVNWIQATNTPSWSARDNHVSIAFNNKLWVMGGQNVSNVRLNDVWYSEDGENWIAATSSAAWPGRRQHTSTVFDNKIWIWGGQIGDNSRVNDVWYSEDGASWTLASNSAEWAGRSGHTSVVFDNKLWILGGINNSDVRLNDIWYSDDGENWIAANDDASWLPRASLTSEVFKNKLWIMGGFDGTDNYHDVFSTPNNTISHYQVCWDTTQSQCANSAQVAPDGTVIASHTPTTNQSWLAQARDFFFPTAHAQSTQLSFTMPSTLSAGTWYFSVSTVTMSGEQSPLAATSHIVASEAQSGLAETGTDASWMLMLSTTLVVLGSYIFIKKTR